ncbi:MAG: lactate utilization protein, partial [Bacteroidetes bacterium]|nr:lactate utilization protein [Bacteroidota bacterium]
MSAAFEQKIHVALSDIALQSAIQTATSRFAQKREEAVAPQALPAYQELRDQAQLIKQHTLDNLDYYLELLETKVRQHGGEVLWCRDGEAAAKAVVSIARKHQVRLAVKAKS